MASSVPASLKSSGIVPFATRAHQLEKVKPAVAYWCNYWIVKQIVTKGLHNSDEESKAYTAGLMDKLETLKIEHSSEDAIVDDVAAKAYLEQFGLEVFNRADNAIRNSKASKQTADTFQAAYTFLELLQIWPPLEAEIAAKIKFAKYHALRIAKAVKAGEDPNLSNPPVDTEPEQVDALDPKDPEVQALGGLGSPQVGHQPSIEEFPDEHDAFSPSLAQTSTLDRPLHPSRTPSTAFEATGPINPPPASIGQGNSAENYYSQQTDGGDVSPLAPSTHERANSEGGGYFPRIAQTPQDIPSSITQPPAAAPSQPAMQSALGSPSAPPPISPLQPSPTNAYLQRPHNYPPQTMSQSPRFALQSGAGYAPGPNVPPAQTAAYPPPPHQPQWPPAQPSALPPNPQPISHPPPVASAHEATYTTDEEALTKAQKHARWAISALNFEDVKTAVLELQKALETLGAR